MFYVYFKFAVDSAKITTMSTNIQHFAPASVTDYDKHETYSCFWEGDIRTCGGFYDGRILHMTEHKKDMDDFIATQRPRGGMAVTSAKPQKSQHKRNEAERKCLKRKQEEELAGWMEGSGSGETQELVPKALLDKKEAELRSLKHKNRSLDKRITELQRALCSKIFEKEESFSVAGSILNTSEVLSVPVIGEGNQQLGTVPVEVLNSHSEDSAVFQTEMTDDHEVALPCAEKCGPAESPKEPLVGFLRDDGQVHAGCGVWLQKDTWETLLQQTRDSLFCKSMATAIWSPEVLAQRSVSGTLPNRAIANGATKPHPPLTPKKYHAVHLSFRYYLAAKGVTDGESVKKRTKDVRKYLAQKMGDLRRNT